MSDVSWDDPIFDVEDDDIDPDEFDVLSDEYGEIGIQVVSLDSGRESPFGWDITELIDWESEDGESRFD